MAVVVYTQHCVQLNCIYATRAIVQRVYVCVYVCETREETRCNGTYKSHNNLIDPAQSSRSGLLNSSMLGLRLAGKCFCGGGSDLFVASGLSNGSSDGNAAEFMSGGEDFRLDFIVYQ